MNYITQMFTLIYKRRNKYMKKIIATIAVVLCICVLFAGCGNNSEPEPKPAPNLYFLYNRYCDNTYAKIASDRSYLYVGTKMHGYFNRAALEAIRLINSDLGLPDSLFFDMENTTFAMGKQEETFESKGIKVSWTYHPDYGLEVTYKLIVN